MTDTLSPQVLIDALVSTKGVKIKYRMKQTTNTRKIDLEILVTAGVYLETLVRANVECRSSDSHFSSGRTIM